MSNFRAVVMGVSAGGLNLLQELIPQFPANFPLAVAIAYHRADDSDDFVTQHLGRDARLSVREPEDKEPIQTGVVYLSPPGYHLLIEQDLYFSLSVDARVNHSRPSIDVLFESAAEAYGEGLIGVILTGANGDGAAGMVKIAAFGGRTVVQDPRTAEADIMPQFAIQALKSVDHILSPRQIVPHLCRLAGGRGVG